MSLDSFRQNAQDCLRRGKGNDEQNGSFLDSKT